MTGLRDEALREIAMTLAKRIRDNEIRTPRPVEDLLRSAQELDLLEGNKAFQNEALDLLSDIKENEKINPASYADRLEALAEKLQS